jgi:tRNA threonylcarbamoyladenosine biosynthesis protein TsaE
VKRALPDLAAMETFGTAIADQARAGDVIALSGELGTGKTTLARAILARLGHQGDVPSPTFTILELYEAASMRIAAVHADFYRLDDPADARELGLEDYREDAVLIAEWPQQAGGFAHLPECLSIGLEIVGHGREAIVKGGADWLERMP